jgi:hypothetical protein
MEITPDGHLTCNLCGEPGGICVCGFRDAKKVRMLVRERDRYADMISRLAGLHLISSVPQTFWHEGRKILSELDDAECKRILEITEPVARGDRLERENKRLRTLVEQVWQECNDYYDLDADLKKYGIEAFTTPALRGLYDIRRALADEGE